MVVSTVAEMVLEEVAPAVFQRLVPMVVLSVLAVYV